LKLTTDELGNLLDLARSKFPLYSVWQHYKGGIYEVVGHTLHTSEPLETLVVYRRIGGPDFYALAERGITYARPVKEWNEVVYREIDNLHLARLRRVA
jgi:hypothetical protein